MVKTHNLNRVHNLIIFIYYSLSDAIILPIFHLLLSRKQYSQNRKHFSSCKNSLPYTTYIVVTPSGANKNLHKNICGIFNKSIYIK